MGLSEGSRPGTSAEISPLFLPWPLDLSELRERTREGEEGEEKERGRERE